MISRRRFLQSASIAAALDSRARARKLSTIGVQLYTVREVMSEKPAETLRAIDAIGYREAEANSADLEKLVPAIRATHLRLVALHLDLKVGMNGSDDDLARVIASVRSSGATYLVFPYVPSADRGGIEKTKAFAGRLNRIGEKCRAAGLSLCYHNHCFEFEPIDGTTRFQVMMDSTDKKLVGLEMDAFWVSVGGQDPAELLAKMAGRVPLVHLKDKASGTPVMYRESVPKSTFKEIGNGVLDWAKVLRAAQAAGVKHYFVEQDHKPGDPMESLRKRFQYLQKLDF